MKMMLRSSTSFPTNKIDYRFMYVNKRCAYIYTILVFNHRIDKYVYDDDDF